LDLGTGTGKTLDALEGSAEKVVGIDRNAALLSVAKQKVNVGTELVQGEVNQLPFEDGTFDLATSSGLTGSLDRETLSGFYKELARALKPNGIYVEVAPWPFDDYVDEQDTRITASSKAMLADMIVDTVSGKHQIVDHLEPVEQMDLFKSLDLGIKHYDVPSKDGKTRSLLTVMTKIN
jgi:ubiquinone/menaquinone biosynthesis C-methylase UbiE